MIFKWISPLVSFHRIDALIFDIDGVLIDTRLSYSESIRIALDIFLKEVLGFSGPDKFFPYEDVEMFKLAGGFNNEWNILKAITIFFIAKSLIYNTKDLDILKEKEPRLAPLLKKLREEGGGFSKFLQLLKDAGLPVDNVRYDEDELVKIGMESYAGKYTKILYGFEPKYFKGDGVIEEERPLMREDLIDVVRGFKLGVVTGRLKEEVDIIKPKIKLFELVDDRFILTNSEIPDKPNPKGFEILKKRLKFDKAIFIGDTMDDFRVVENYNKKVGEKELFSCMVLSRGTENDALVRFETYKKVGADFIFPNVNEFLIYLRDEYGK